MSARYIVVLLAMMTCFFACRTEQKMTYDFPPAMSASIRTGYTELCEKGRVLYGRSCAGCHNVKVKGRTVIPDFSQEQLLGYALRVSNKKHEANMPDSLVSVEDLSLISTFLTYKQKNSFSTR